MIPQMALEGVSGFEGLLRVRVWVFPLTIGFQISFEFRVEGLGIWVYG